MLLDSVADTRPEIPAAVNKESIQIRKIIPTKKKLHNLR